MCDGGVRHMRLVGTSGEEETGCCRVNVGRVPFRGWWCGSWYNEALRLLCAATPERLEFRLDPALGHSVAEL